MKNFIFFFFLILCAAGCDSNQNATDVPVTGASSSIQIVWTDPLPGAVGPNIMSPNNVVKIRFNSLMNSRSVIRAVSISPTNESVYIDTNTASPVEGTTFDFPLTPTPVWLAFTRDASLDSRFPAGYRIDYPSFKVAQTYTIFIASSAQDIYGDSLASQNSFSFTPEPYFRVTDTYPVNNDTAISPIYPYVSIRFNAVIDTSSAQSSFLTFSPQVGGTTYVYYGSWGLSWSLPAGAMFASETRYTATVGTSIRDVDGHVPPSPYSFSFTTAPYMVTAAYPTGNAAGVNSVLYIYCNFLIDSTSAASAFSISPAVNGSLQYNGTEFTFTPSAALLANTTYKATISASLRATNGTTIKTPYSFSFTTGN